MRKEVQAVYRRPISKHRRKAVTSKGRASIHFLFRVVALVCILGSAAYLLFTWNSTEPQLVQARQPSVSDSTASTVETTEVSLDSSTEADNSDPSPGASEDKADLLTSVTSALSNASASQKNTVGKLLAFAESGSMAEVRNLSRDDIESLTEFLETAWGTDALAALMESRLGMPTASFHGNRSSGSVIADLFEAIAADRDPSDTQQLIFTDRVEADGTVTGSAHVVPAGTKRVYAAFENKGAMQNLDKVLAVWRNPADDRMVFTEFESVRSGSTYNYVWLELKDGWPPGFYQLDLFHPQRNTELLASRSFNVR